MNKETRKLLEQHFDTAFDAPDGIKKLRELILTLAMQGKLVPQDPNDQPASELLKEIEAEKKRLIKEGKIKKPKPLPPIKPEEIPYEIPKSWQWVQLVEIGEINPRNSFDDNKNAGFVPMPLISADYGVKHEFETRKWSEIKKGYTHFKNGDVGLAKITPCFENGKSCIFENLPNDVGAGTTELHIFRNTFDAVHPPYLLTYLKNPRYLEIGASKMTGSAGQKRVPAAYFGGNPFPLPPFAEQQRIVEKIDQLMARVDELENLRKEREDKRLKIHKAVIDQLLSAKTQTDFAAAWSFITGNFNSLYSVKENVAELRKAILQLAVMGKLVPQDPDDQPASELLKEIEAEKKRLIKEGKIKPQKPLPPIKPEEIPYDIPRNWKWIRLGTISEIIGGYAYKSGQFLSDGINQVLRLGNVKPDLIKIGENPVFIDDEYAEKTREFKLIEQDILITMTGTRAKKDYLFTALISKNPYKGKMLYLNQRVGAIRAFLCANYLNKALKVERLQEMVFSTSTGSANQANIGINSLRQWLIPLPPGKEQQRIVEKVDQLMTLCDKLEQNLTIAAEKQTDLLNSLMAKV
jgi:type I restriction enzyme S subunit